MKLIDILVEELPPLGGWPEDVEAITQDSDRSINNYRTADGLETNEYGTWRCSSAWQCYLLSRDDVSSLADDYATAIITREQYEAALAAKNDGWIEWGGVECPVPRGTLVDVRYRDGRQLNALSANDGTLNPRDASFVFWRNDGSEKDIIAYRLHKTNEAERVRDAAWNAYAAITKADDEADLNECIGQDAAPVWNGEGLPPVGCVCERSWAGDKWLQCEIIFTGNEIVLVKLATREAAYHLSDVRFRSILSEADKKRDAAIEAIDWYMPECILDTPNEFYHAKKIYDAIAAGKIPGVKLEV